jgi:Predicted P-loop ATPase and inactivated derivatives
MNNIAEIEVPSTPPQQQQKTEKPKKEKKAPQPKPPSPRQLAREKHATVLALSGIVSPFDRDGRIDSTLVATLMYLADFGYEDRLRLDETTKKIYLDDEWIKDVDGFCAEIRNRLPKIYPVKGQVLKQEVVDTVYGAACKNRFNPIKDLYASIGVWDGIPRLETFFIRHYGVEDSRYARHVAQIFFTQIIARISHPGCKVDFMLVLFGEQGTGKSLLGKKLLTAMGYPQLALRPEGTAFGKTLVVDMLGKVIVEIDEMNAINRRDSSEVKGFITTEEDTLRIAYEKYATTFPRTQVLYGTTNERVFIKDKENRRFLPLNCAALPDLKEPIWTVSDEYIQQVFAEAKHLYDSGFKYWVQPEDLREVSKEYMNEDEVFMDTVEQAVERAKNLALTAKPPRSYITTPEVMGLAHGLDKNVFMQGRVREKLREMGFRRNTKKVNGKAVKVWEFE